MYESAARGRWSSPCRVSGYDVSELPAPFMGIEMQLFTIGYSGKSAAQFFGLLRSHNVRRVVDIRLKNTSRLSGYARKDDLPFLLREICGASYDHELLLAPTPAMLDALRSEAITSSAYLLAFRVLIKERHVASRLKRESFREATALLCAEADPVECHRSVAAEHLAAAWKDVTVVHI